MMRRPIISLTALLTLTLPGYAQVNPNNLPANTVVGRLGTGTGPAQAIPFAFLQANLPPLSTLSGDCTVNGSNVITCTKTNNVAFSSAATTAIGTSAATIPLLNGTNTWANTQTFAGVTATGATITGGGSVTLNGATSGSVVIAPQATAGSPTLTLGNTHVAFTSAAPPTITAGCTGAGSAVGTGSSDFDGNITGSTAAATTCTITFGTAFTNTPSCVTSGDQSPILTQTRATNTLVVTFASTANYRFNWHCGGV